MSNRVAVRIGIWVMVLVAMFGIVARLQIMVQGLARPMAANIFFRLYALYEMPFLLLLLGTAMAMALVMRASPHDTEAEYAWLVRVPPPRRRLVAMVALAIFVVTLLTTRWALHGYAFSMDEFSTDFQALIFAHGKLRVVLPSSWRPFAFGMTPVFIAFTAPDGAWFSAYLPVYSLLKAPFAALGAGTLLNPMLAALSIIAMGGVARRLWPTDPLRSWLAIALLATSSQFIVTSGTAYSMPAHLCLNLIWLWLYLRGDGRSWAGALIVGVLALGLHNPFPHALFVAPFLVRLARDRRWKRLAWAALAYGSASVLWFSWLRSGYQSASHGGGLLDVFAMPNGSILWLHAINLSLLLTWQVPVFGLLVVAALVGPRRLESPFQDLAWGVLITLIFYMFFPTTQGHGWGYRYAYQVLGNLALLAAAGVTPLRAVIGRRRTTLALAGALVIALMVQLPLRLVDTEQFVRPFAAGAEYLRTRPADVVLVHGDSIWYGRDLVRNDPFLRGQPVMISAGALTDAGRAALERAHPGRIMDVSDSELLRLGMTRWANHP